jgi:hypothetical protein
LQAYGKIPDRETAPGPVETNENPSASLREYQHIASPFLHRKEEEGKKGIGFTGDVCMKEILVVSCVLVSPLLRNLINPILIQRGSLHLYNIQSFRVHPSNRPGD